MTTLDQLQVDVNNIFGRIRKIELILSFMFGTILFGGGSIAAKLFGFLG